MFRRIGNTWSIMGQSWGILKAEKSLLLLPVISGILCLAIVFSFAFPWIHHGVITTDVVTDDAGVTTGNTKLDVALYGLMFGAYLCCYFVIIFFNSALIACTSLHMAGKPSGLSEGFGVALKRLPQIVGWALVSATVGVLLRVLENQKIVGQILASILGAVWSLLTFLAVPALVLEGYGPFSAFGASAKLLKKTWGEQIVGGFSFGIIFFLLMIPAFIVAFLAIMTSAASGTVGILLFALIGLYLIGLSVIQSALMTVFQTSLYLYARDGKAPAGFQASVLSGAIARS